MATSRVPNRYVKRLDLIKLLDGLWPGEYTIEVRDAVADKLR